MPLCPNESANTECCATKIKLGNQIYVLAEFKYQIHKSNFVQLEVLKGCGQIVYS